MGLSWFVKYFDSNIPWNVNMLNNKEDIFSINNFDFRVAIIIILIS